MMLLLLVLILAIHLLFILWVIFGAVFTRRRPILRWSHIASLIYTIVIEIIPSLPCPLTLLEQKLENQAGLTSYRGPFLVHYLDRLVYPDVPIVVLTLSGLAVCILNLAVYVRRFRHRQASGW